MKFNELIKEFSIQMSNEEKTLLDKISKPCYVESFSQREQYVIENLIKKSLLSKVYYKGSTVVIPNERP
jgi:hypothetical protein